MSLMKLAPETVRLRRVAKAHALGEFSLAEYRRARREIIDNFEPHRVDEDDTQPRQQTAAVANGTPAPISVVPTRPHPRRWLVWLLVAGAVLAASQILADEAPLDVPAVVDRDPNPATSPRLVVRSVDLADPARLDGLSVDAAGVQAVIDARLAEIRQRNQPGNHGFTETELEEVGRFLNALGAHNPKTTLSARDAADLSALIADQKARRGVSIVELEEVASAVQSYLRAAGYFLAVAYVPAQTVQDGRVAIDFQPGVLGEVRVAGAPDRLSRRFDDLIGRPVTQREINTRLYALNRAPGFAARASFEPGDAVGETRLNLDVLEKRTLYGSVRLDNYGDDYTGRQRVVLGADLVNPAGRGDVLRMGLTAALDPDNQLLGFAEYSTPIGGRRLLRGRIARNAFNTGGIEDIDSTAWVADAVLETFLRRDRLSGLSWEIGAGRHELSWKLPAGGVDQTVTLVSAAFKGRRVWDAARVAADLRLYADAGSIDGQTFAGQDDRFWDLGLDVLGWHPFDLAFLPGRQKASVRVRGQLASTQLPSTRRLALGGISGARGFERDAFLADQGVLLRGDLRTPVMLGDLVLFGDAVYGKTRNQETSAWAHLANLGLAWEVQIGSHFTSSVSWAVPITAKGTGGLDDDGAIFFWSLRYGR